jgi:mannose-6-phosphate isomerase-like protein (cupin superfamily)
MTISVPGKYLVRHGRDVDKERSTCGYRHRLLSTGDAAPAFAHVVKIGEAQPHYHKKASELYYVLEGGGVLILDGERVAIERGSLALIEPGVVHSAEGEMLVLVIGIPDISDEDMFFPEK